MSDDSINIKNLPVIHKHRTEPAHLHRYKETDIERLMYEALQDFAYHRWAVRHLMGHEPRAEENWQMGRGCESHLQAVKEHLNHHREMLEQARDRIRRYAKRLPPN